MTNLKLFGLKCASVIALIISLIIPGLASQKNSQEKAPQHTWKGSRTTPVHLLQLRDENDQIIVPKEPYPLPLSQRNTCGPCHEYQTIKNGLHFGGQVNLKSKRTGEPWFLVDQKTGTVLPVSYHGWKGSFKPEALGLTSWDMTLLFSRHSAGGGFGEPDLDQEPPDPKSRWNVSGKLEINCLACHSRSPRQDHSEWAKQTARENLRWAATAASGIGEVRGMASRIPETWDVYDGPNPDDKEWAVPPSVIYRAVDFDLKHRFYFDLSHKPENKRCLECHSVSPVNSTRADIDPDIHLTSGVSCADCHRNSLDHKMVRGYEGESLETGQKIADSFTCRGCHLGEDARNEKIVVPGRLGAPYPRHPGLPLVHFKRLACTVCHSGASIQQGVSRVRTSRANRLGIYGIADWATDWPAVFEPIYAKDSSGKIAPHRIVWPSFWAKIKGKEIAPLKPEEVAKAAGEILNPESRLAEILIALSQTVTETQTPVLCSGRIVFELNVDGGIDAFPVPSEIARNKHFWAVKEAGAIQPLIKDFDPKSPDKDPDIETNIQAILKALQNVTPRPGEPVFIIGKTRYQLVDDNLETSEIEVEAREENGLFWLKEGKLEPLVPEYDLNILIARAGTDKTLTEQQVADVLAALAKNHQPEDETGYFAYISSGKVFRLNRKGKLTAESSPAASPVLWPLAHDVRPAQQALGKNGCGDCHSFNSGFFFTRIKAESPLLTGRAEKKSSISFMGLTALYQKVFGFTFIFRPYLKFVLALCGFIILALFLLAGFAALGRISGLSDRS